MKPTDEAMVAIGTGPLPTPEIELERSTVTAEQVRRFLRSAAPGEATATATAPLTFALALRRGHGPEAAISPRAFAIHGGHDIEMHAPIAVGETYVVSGRVERVYAKTGRTGPLTVVERRVWIRDAAGRPAAEIADRQIVRWKPQGDEASSPGRRREQRRKVADEAIPTPPAAASLELGDAIGPYRRRGPTAAEISGWADTLRDREVLFHDRRGARALGFEDLVVPGPMQSAFIDRWLAAAAPAWQATRLHMTFRQSLLAGEALAIEAVVVDGDDRRRSLDVLVRNADSGETTSTGTVVLQLRAPVPKRLRVRG
jgi:hypothetical protein